MIKSRLWHEVLDLQICWRFFKYKLILDDTRSKFMRDKEFLEQAAVHANAGAVPWKLPCSITTVVKCIERLTPDLHSLKEPLTEINQMICPYYVYC